MPIAKSVTKYPTNRRLLITSTCIFGAISGVLLIVYQFSILLCFIAIFSSLFFALSLAHLIKALDSLPEHRLSSGYIKTLVDVCLSRPQVFNNDQQAEISKIFVPEIVEGSITSRAQLGEALSDLMTIAFEKLPIVGMEISLFESKSNLNFFSYLMGTVSPLDNDDILAFPLSFSGKVLGSVRYTKEKESVINHEIRELAKLITLQVGVVFVNAEYSAELLRMQQSTDESMRVKTGFLANLSHEVRAPLGVIVNAMELVVDGLVGEITDDQKRILGLAKKGSEHLLELINDVLDFAKIEAGKMAPKKKVIALSEVLKDVTGIVRFQAHEKHIEVDFKEGIEELAVLIDRKHLRQILINLLTNAVKYTPEGGKVEVWAERAPANMIKINVKDTGVGIDPTHRSKVFAPFERLNHAYSRQQAGVGLGLSLARKLAELNGGSLDFESKLGSGSRFWLLAKSTELDILDKQEDKNRPLSLKGNGESILIIDYDIEHLSIQSKYLSELGYKITAYSRFEEARSFVTEGNFQILIMDNTEIDNDESGVAADITKLVQNRNIPVLLLSSRAFVFDLEKYLKLGIERCLPKPVALKELAQLCKELLESRLKESGGAGGGSGSKGGAANEQVEKELLH